MIGIEGWKNLHTGCVIFYAYTFKVSPNIITFVITRFRKKRLVFNLIILKIRVEKDLSF